MTVFGFGLSSFYDLNSNMTSRSAKIIAMVTKNVSNDKNNEEPRNDLTGR